MSEEQNPRIEASKRKLSDAFEIHQHIRASIGLNPFNLLQRIKAGVQNFQAQRSQQTQHQASGAGCDVATQTVPTGAQQVPTNTPRRGLFGLGILSAPPLQPPPPPTEAEKKEIAEQEELKKLADKKQEEKRKRRRLDTMQGLSIDRT